MLNSYKITNYRLNNNFGQLFTTTYIPIMCVSKSSPSCDALNPCTLELLYFANLNVFEISHHFAQEGCTITGAIRRGSAHAAIETREMRICNQLWDSCIWAAAHGQIHMHELHHGLQIGISLVSIAATKHAVEKKESLSRKRRLPSCGSFDCVTLLREALVYL